MRDKDLAKRSLVSVISISVVTLCLFFAYYNPFRYGLVLLLSALSAISVSEYTSLVLAKGQAVRRSLLMGLSFFVTASFFISSSSTPLCVWSLFFSLLVLFAVRFRATSGSILELASSFFGLLYIAVPLGMVLGILYTIPLQDGRLWVAYVLAVTKLTDMGAYFGGNLLGKRKLAEKISPKKTIEGALCGLLVAVIVSLSINFYFPSFQLSQIEAIFLGALLGCLGQFGDLAESLLKRDANKKDSNHLPGIGGALDAVDSLLFTVPLVYFYLSWVSL